ncbi:MAG: glycosyltransferase family 39 protein [Planctomycetes bacterium]|nr:glycosyltransferase family 39 protein [Planctomycetota bacterium]
MAAAVLVGLLLRIAWFVADPCVWWDEVWLILNVLHKPLAGLAGPLDHNQAAPPVFLWAVKVCTMIFGDGTHALRLVPFVASCAGFVLIAAIGGGYPRSAVLAAVVLLAGSSKMLGHTAEVKPYTLDFCAAAALAVWFGRTADRSLTSRIRTAAAVCPAAVLLVYPGCFLAGGVLLGLAIGARRRTELLLLALAGALTTAAFALLLTGPAGAQQTPVLRNYWVELGHFPDWSRPQSLPGWLWSGVTGVFRYCLYPLGMAFVPFAAVGFASLWRGGRRDVAVFLAAPMGLALIAGLLGKYPFGGSRLYLFAAPGLALLTAVGIRCVWDRLASSESRGARIGRVAVAAVTCWGIVEGATFPLFGSSRVEVRPAVEFLKARPAGEDVIVADHVFAYYLRREPGVSSLDDPPRARTGGVWVAGGSDRTALTAVPPRPGDPPPTVTRYGFGSAAVFRLDLVPADSK